MAGLYDGAADEIAADEDRAARAAQPGSTLPPPPAVALNPSDELPGLPADPPALGRPEPAQAAPVEPAPAPLPAFDAAPAVGLYDAAADAVKQDDEARFSSAIEAARQSDPERYAEVAGIAARDGLPIEFVSTNLDDLRSRATANDMRKVLTGNERLRRWFETGDNANAVKHDDLHKLSGMDWLMRSTGEAWTAGWDQRQSADIRFRQMFGTATPEEIKLADSFDKQETRDYGAQGFIQGAPTALAKQLPSLIGSTAAGFSRAAPGATFGAAIGAGAGAAAGGIGAAPGAAAGFAVGTAAGITVGRAEDNFRQEAGGAYGEFIRFRTDDGQSLDPDIAKGAAIVAGLANAGLETLGEAALERLIPGLDKVGVASLLRYGSREGIKAALQRPTVRAAFKAFGVNALRAGSAEVATEVAQEAVTILAGTLAQKADGGEFQQLEAADVRGRLTDAATETAQAMLILSPSLASSRLGRDVRTARRSAEMASVYQNAQAVAEGTELRTREPGRYMEAIKSFLGDGRASDTVYVDTGKLTELFQEKGLNPTDLDSRIEGFSQRYAEAVATGSQVHIDMADYATHIAGTPLGESLLEHQTWHPELLSVAEANKALDEARSTQEALLEDAVTAARDEMAQRAPAEQVFERVYAQLVNIGESPETARTQAALARSFFGATAQRAGMDPLALYEAQRLEIRRAMPDGLDYRRQDELDLALNAIREGQGDRAERLRQRGRGPSLASFLAGRGGLVETDTFRGELTSRDLKYFKRGKLLGKPGKGLGIDTASLAAAEAGYFPGAVDENGDIDRSDLVRQFLAALDEELADRPQFTRAAEDVRLDPQLERILGLSDELASLGLDTSSMTNEEIRAELMRATSPDATQGALFQFAGQTAARRFQSSSDALNTAQDMETAGRWPDEIYEATGFFRGVDGQWRIEIDDSAATMRDEAFVAASDGGEDYTGPIAGVFQHAGLFSAYPELRGIEVRVGIGAEKNTGFYDENTNRIEIDAKDLAGARSVMLHEIAHAIQAIEGFARGGNTKLGEIYEGEIVKSYQDALSNIDAQAREITSQLENNRGNMALADKARELVPRLLKRREEMQRGLKDAAGYEYYRRIAGEVEARNVQERDEMRRAPPDAASYLDAPLSTQDVPSSDQIILVYAPRRGAVFEAMSAGTPEIREFYQTNDLAGAQGDKRGSIQFMPERTVINLFKAANLSTFLHESGHLYLEVTKQVAERDGASDQVRQDWQTVLTYIGAKPGEAIPREAHERFAKAFETYLSEGRAPSEELRGVFERFKSWLLYVYRGAARAIGLPSITPEIRDVFDRMLATDAEIAEVRRDPAVRPMFDSAEAAGLTGAQWSRMVKQAESATDAAKGEMLARLVADKRREQTREWRSQKETIRQEVFDEFSTRPVYQVQHYIRTGEILNSAEVAPSLENRRLDRSWLVNHFGDGVLKALPRQVPPIYTTKGGLDPNEVADWFGFDSGEHMVRELISAVPFARAVVAETDVRMRERNGDLLSNQAEMARAATEAFHNDVRTPFLEAELEALAGKAQLKARKVLATADARATARAMIRGKRVSEAGRVSVFERARDRAAREAEALALKGDFAAAVTAKRNQIINHHLAIESRKARDEAETIRRYLDRFVARKRPPGVDPDYLDQIDGVLEGVDLKASTSQRKIERRKGLAAWMAEQEAAGASFVVPRELIEDAALKSYKDMTMEDFGALRDIVKNIEHLGRLKNRILEKSRLRSFTAARDELVAQARRTPNKRQIKARNPDKWEKFQARVATVDAYFLKVEQIFEWLDFADVNGPFQRIIFQRFVDAQNRKGEMMRQYAERVNTILGGKPKSYLAERLSVPARPDLSFTRGELYAIALNQGTESNRAKLLAGETVESLGGRSFRNEDEMNSALSLLTKEDWDTVQSIWDTLESLWPETAALERRVTGVEPPKLERRQVETAHGTYAGGYYPMVYDPAESADVAQRAAKDADQLFDSKVYQRPAVAHGFTKARVENYSRPVKLDLAVLPAHLEAAIHNITHREAVRDVLKFIDDKDLTLALRETMGPAVHAELRNWLGRVATDRGVPSTDTVAGAILSSARSNISTYAMGWRVTTALSQLAGWINSMEKVKPWFLAAALRESVIRPRETWEFITSRSGEMRDRSNNRDRDVRFALRTLEDGDGPVAWFKRTAFLMTSMADRAVAAPTWLGGYNQHLRSYPGDEAGAIRAGDVAVRLTQGAGGAKDLSSVLGNQGPAALLTMFYSYFNLLYNRLRTLGRDTRVMFQDGSYEDLPHLVARSLTAVVLPAIMADLIVGKGPDREEDETWPWWAVKKAALYPLASVPLARDIGGALDSGLDYQFSPLARYGELTVKLIGDAGAAIKGEPNEGRLVAKRAAELAGYTLGLPLGQGVSTGSNIWQGLERGDLKIPKDIFFNRRAYGDERKR